MNTSTKSQSLRIADSMRGAKRWPGAMASRSSQIDTCAGSGSVSRRTSALLSLA